ncbi:MAG: dTDP-4-dehydrorhamnose 3,5-epimerase [Solirubrobacteraceae bacterium]
MKRLPTRLEGPVLLEPRVFGDARGFFHESFRADQLRELGIDAEFVQDNHSRSARGVLRGLHLQTDGLAKLVRCARGRIFDVVLDVRPDSATFGQWEGWELDDESLRQVFVPSGFAHGFLTLSEVADVIYKQDGYWRPEFERSVNYADPEVGIAWPQGIEFKLSEKDAAAAPLSELHR